MVDSISEVLDTEELVWGLDANCVVILLHCIQVLNNDLSVTGRRRIIGGIKQYDLEILFVPARIVLNAEVFNDEAVIRRIIVGVDIASHAGITRVEIVPQSCYHRIRPVNIGYSAICPVGTRSRAHCYPSVRTHGDLRVIVSVISESEGK